MPEIGIVRVGPGLDHAGEATPGDRQVTKSAVGEGLSTVQAGEYDRSGC